MKVRCSHCGGEYELEMPAGTVRLHDYPKPCRAVCPGSGKTALVPSITEYTLDDIDENRKDARLNAIALPGWYAWDGPEGDEVMSGPFTDPHDAAQHYTEWRE